MRPCTDETVALEAAIERTTDPFVGQVLEGKYRLVRLLGRGGMGSVYEARHLTLERRFALKFLLNQYAGQPELLRRFEREAIAAGRLEHANIAAVTDMGRTESGAPFLVMEYLTGADCARLLASAGPLPLARAANIVSQACHGLAVAHAAGIVHRDIKPENLFITDAGNGADLVKVLDFGIAKLRSPEAGVATATGTLMGTCHYMSPEQVRDSGKVDPRTDVWSLGVVLYELLSGRKPFDGTDAVNIFYRLCHHEPEPLNRWVSDLPAALLEIVESTLKKDPGERCPSVAALARELAPFSGIPSIAPAVEVASDARSASMTARSPASTSMAGVATLSSMGEHARPGRRGVHGPRAVAAGVGAAALAVVVVVTWIWRASGPAAQVAPPATRVTRGEAASSGEASLAVVPSAAVATTASISGQRFPTKEPGEQKDAGTAGGRTSSGKEREAWPRRLAGASRAGAASARARGAAATPVHAHASASTPATLVSDTPPASPGPEPRSGERRALTIDTENPF